MKKIKILIILVLFLVIALFPISKVGSSYQDPKLEIISYYIQNQTHLDYQPNQVVVNFYEKEQHFLNYLKDTYQFEVMFLYQTTYKITFNNSYTTLMVLNILNSYPEIKHAEPNYLLTPIASPTTEPNYHNQWAFTDQNYGINIHSVWNETLGSRQVVVAVIDTGIDYNHIDLKDNIWTNTNESINGKDDDGNGYIDDYYGWNFGDNNNNPIDTYGHGTFVAGIIASKVNNIGIAGTAPNVRVMALRVSNNEDKIFLSNVAKAINYALDKNVRIINISLISTGTSVELENLIKNANALFICGAGNDAQNNNNNPVYPANYNFNNVIAVAAINSSGNLASFSNYGSNTIDLAAPGVTIISTALNNNFGFSAGTSFATPYVSGVAALILSQNPTLSSSELKQRINKSTKFITSQQNKTITEGILNARGAFFYLRGDINGDKQVNIGDLILLRRYLAGLQNIDYSLHANADITNNSDINIGDLIRLRRYLAGLGDL